MQIIPWMRHKICKKNQIKHNITECLNQNLISTLISLTVSWHYDRVNLFNTCSEWNKIQDVTNNSKIKIVYGSINQACLFQMLQWCNWDFFHMPSSQQVPESAKEKENPIPNIGEHSNIQRRLFKQLKHLTRLVFIFNHHVDNLTQPKQI